MLRKHYIWKPQNMPPQEADLFDADIFVDKDSGQIQHTMDYVDERDPNLWTSKNWSIEVPLGQSIILKSRHGSPLSGSRPASALNAVPPGVVLDAEWTEKLQDVSAQAGADSHVSSRRETQDYRPSSQCSASGGSRPPSQHSVRVPSIGSPVEHLRTLCVAEFDPEEEAFSSISPIKSPSNGRALDQGREPASETEEEVPPT